MLVELDGDQVLPEEKVCLVEPFVLNGTDFCGLKFHRKNLY